MKTHLPFDLKSWTNLNKILDKNTLVRYKLVKPIYKFAKFVFKPSSKV